VPPRGIYSGVTLPYRIINSMVTNSGTDPIPRNQLILHESGCNVKITRNLREIAKGITPLITNIVTDQYLGRAFVCMKVAASLYD
jgi:hypothetical protein